ncbi:MAG: VOC family protein [Prevotellaceae bacterium]|jgi:catechol 2,3-dioxygenase-like lactoylglutathione lyase family enzyme|nr:VOC family protein [Prevotellaceae bacterium]
MKKIISGIQQVGIGIPNVYEAFDFYKKAFGMDIALFDDNGAAELMLPYTNNQPQNRHAILALNLKGGGGFEIWQYTTRAPLAADFNIELGDLGIFVCKIKSDDVKATYQELKTLGLTILNEPQQAPDGKLHFYVKDAYSNVFEIMEGLPFFSKGKRHTGGAAGVSIGVSNIDASIKFYNDILEYDKVIYDETGTFEDIAALDGGKKAFRRVLLTHSKDRVGPFSRLLGATQIELFEAKDFTPRKMFKDRQWGDFGYIHLCFDVKNIGVLRTEFAEKGHPFTVDSGSGDFDMGEAAGHFAYIEDPDGTLIELVETLKIPILKKIGWYLNVKKRDPEKPLPNGLLKLMRFL